MKIIVLPTYDDVSKAAADLFINCVKEKPNCVLGLATGSTPLGMYGYLVKAYENGLDFSRVTSVNLDEYYPLAPTHEQSYRYFMNKNLFSQINIKEENTYVPNGLAPDPDEEGKAYDARIASLGGVDLQLLGIGENGHIAFNEPEEALYVGTHKTSLTESTIRANSRFFASENEVPRHALTMGIGSIMQAKAVVLLACGKNKREAVRALKNDRITTACPASLLKLHPNVTVFCDKEAAEE